MRDKLVALDKSNKAADFSGILALADRRQAEPDRAASRCGEVFFEIPARLYLVLDGHDPEWFCNL